MQQPVIISIDPGYDRCGVAILIADAKPRILFSTCIQTSKKDSQEKRLAQIYTEITNIVSTYKPNYLAIETLFFSVNKKTAMKVAEARGVALLVAGNCNLSLIELSPQEVKIAMTGNGNSDKTAVQKMVSLALGVTLANKIDDEIDAIAVGFAAVGQIHKKKFF